MCAQIRVWSCLVTDNFGLFTEIAVCKSEFGHVWLLKTLVYLPKLLYANSCVVGGRMA